MCPTTAAPPAAAIEPIVAAPAYATSTAAAPLEMSSAITASPRRARVVRRTFAAPTLPLPATRTSIPARRATRNANGTEPSTYPNRIHGTIGISEYHATERFIARAPRREVAAED